MDTRQLRTLLAIQAHGTFAQAADVVSLTPSAVSQQVQALEDELRVTIFDRSTRPPQPTPQGLQVIEMARDILRREEDTRASLRGDQIAGTLMLGSVRSSALNLLPRALVQMRQQYPDLKPSLRVSLSAALIADVAAGRLDAAVVAEHLGVPTALRWSPFLREPLWLISSDPLPDSDVADLLRSRPYIRFRSPVPLANLIDTEISRLGVVTNDVAEIDTIGTLVTCVRQGLGLSIVPHVALEKPEGLGLFRLPFGNPPITRQIGIVERTVSPRGAIIERLHGVLADLCGAHGVARRPEGKP
ncbi:LysR substrate-binding domain-containing protein [Marivita sp.]|uniref:LysR substrate-binding domain-containing protein n=1 Tax=Marivita sp. TaxID=2003365 RepID=UPI00262C74F3|nr:LysR substrate-binding domain-containing protein [Marivita sp.]